MPSLSSLKKALPMTYDRQQIQMGLRKGNTVLIHYRRGSDLYQSVLIMQDADLKQGKVNPEVLEIHACKPRVLHLLQMFEFPILSSSEGF